MDGASTYSIFAIENGVVKIVNAKIKQADIEDLLIKGIQIEPGAVSLAKNANIPNRSGPGTYDFTISHGLNLLGAHHESRFEFVGTGSFNSSAGFSITLTDVESGQTLMTISRSSTSAFSSPWSEFRYFTIPTGGRTSTTIRITFTTQFLVNFTGMQLGVFIFKNVPDNI